MRGRVASHQSATFGQTQPPDRAVFVTAALFNPLRPATKSKRNRKWPTKSADQRPRRRTGDPGITSELWCQPHGLKVSLTRYTYEHAIKALRSGGYHPNIKVVAACTRAQQVSGKALCMFGAVAGRVLLPARHTGAMVRSRIAMRLGARRIGAAKIAGRKKLNRVTHPIEFFATRSFFLFLCKTRKLQRRARAFFSVLQADTFAIASRPPRNGKPRPPRNGKPSPSGWQL